jgi:hypothetical protein
MVRILLEGLDKQELEMRVSNQDILVLIVNSLGREVDIIN